MQGAVHSSHDYLQRNFDWHVVVEAVHCLGKGLGQPSALRARLAGCQELQRHAHTWRGFLLRAWLRTSRTNDSMKRSTSQSAVKEAAGAAGATADPRFEPRVPTMLIAAAVMVRAGVSIVC